MRAYTISLITHKEQRQKELFHSFTAPDFTEAVNVFYDWISENKERLKLNIVLLSGNQLRAYLGRQPEPNDVGYYQVKSIPFKKVGEKTNNKTFFILDIHSPKGLILLKEMQNTINLF